MSSRASVASVGIYCPCSVAGHTAEKVDPDTRSLRSLLRDDSSTGAAILRDDTSCGHPLGEEMQAMQARGAEPFDLTKARPVDVGDPGEAERTVARLLQRARDAVEHRAVQALPLHPRGHGVEDDHGAPPRKQ